MITDGDIELWEALYTNNAFAKVKNERIEKLRNIIIEQSETIAGYVLIIPNYINEPRTVAKLNEMIEAEKKYRRKNIKELLELQNGHNDTSFSNG